MHLYIFVVFVCVRVTLCLLVVSHLCGILLSLFCMAKSCATISIIYGSNDQVVILGFLLVLQAEVAVF